MIETTVIIAAYRAEETLGACVESVLGASPSGVEILIADDASPDGTAAVADALAQRHAQIRVLRLAENGGPGAARNAALAQARGEWVAVLDADDRFCPDRLARLTAFARGHGADIVCDGLVLADMAGRQAPAPPLCFDGAPEGRRWTLPDYLRGNQMRDGRMSLGYLKPLIRRRFLVEHGIAYDPRLRNGEDFHLVLAMLIAGADMRYLPQPGYLYTTRSGSVSHRLDPDHARQLLIADREVLREHAAVLGPRGRAEMRRRIRLNTDLAVAEEAIGLLKARRPFAAGGRIARRPRATARLLRQLSAAARKRLPGAGPPGP
ncbi:glycosyltransferase family 2 protein [Limimaricola hongkongensis]|uniref:glycosyltransferase family 2 protein n=1 Tax=Limimaricola hongkongensis TaxID=278132 RepID=UPI0009D9E472|nr:glycosyltransferase family 2 protein [Limimaricola hongkongensis]